MPLRLKHIYETLSEVIEKYHPDEFAIETAFYGKNAQSALKLGHARGVAMLAAVSRDIPTQEYSPREVKKAIVGNGTASKEQVQYMVMSLLKLKQIPKYYDTTDALAVAICHLHRIYRPGKNYRHPVTKECLGYEAIAIGTAELERFCDDCETISELLLMTSEEAITVGSRLLPSYTSALPPRLTLRDAKRVPEGFIIDVIDGINTVGRNSVVTLSLGTRDKLQEGNFLEIYQTGKTVVDPSDKSWRPCKIKLCDTRIGRLLVYKTFEKLSLALVIEATQPIHLLDKVKTP